GVELGVIPRWTRFDPVARPVGASCLRGANSALRIPDLGGDVTSRNHGAREFEVFLQILSNILGGTLESVVERRANVGTVKEPADLFRDPLRELGARERSNEERAIQPDD